MSRARTSTAKPISTANRIVLHGFVFLFSTVIFTLAARALAAPGLCALGPIYGVTLFTSWLLSDRPMGPWRQWAGVAGPLFIIWPIVTFLVHRLLS